MRTVYDKYQIEVKLLEDLIKINEQRNLSGIKDMKIMIEEMSEEIKLLKQESLEKDMKILELTEVDNRFEVIRSMGKMLDKLNSIMMETADEREKQVVALNSVSNIINVAKYLDYRKSSNSVETQTN